MIGKGVSHIMINFVNIGISIYNLDNWREKRRMWVFVLRAYLHYPAMRKLYEYFMDNAVRRQYLDNNKYPLEQVTRAFFYNKSTMQERIELVKEHIAYITENFKEECALKLARHEFFLLWEDLSGEEPLRLYLTFESGQRKEGLLSLMFRWGNNYANLYQMIFWIARGKTGDWSLWIGAMQGPNMENAKEVVKKVTKQCHAYRTKNLILYVTRIFARTLGLKHIYAVSNYGYYANNHVRSDRKLKTNFGDFWEESGGHVTEDARFYEIPLHEERKSMDEIPTRKRAVYRKRFALLDEIEEVMAKGLKDLMKQGS